MLNEGAGSWAGRQARQAPDRVALVCDRPVSCAGLDDRVRGLARYKVSKPVCFTGALPRTATGKILKKQLRETYGRQPP